MAWRCINIAEHESLVSCCAAVQRLIIGSCRPAAAAAAAVWSIAPPSIASGEAASAAATAHSLAGGEATVRSMPPSHTRWIIERLGACTSHNGRNNYRQSVTCCTLVTRRPGRRGQATASHCMPAVPRINQPKNYKHVPRPTTRAFFQAPARWRYFSRCASHNLTADVDASRQRFM